MKCQLDFPVLAFILEALHFQYLSLDANHLLTKIQLLVEKTHSLPSSSKMERRVSTMAALLYTAAFMAASCVSSEAAQPKASFEDNFSIMWSEDHFKTSEDGQIWYLSLDKETGTHISMHLYNPQSEQTKEFFIRSLIEWDEYIIYSLLNVQDLQSY
jgi:hypothetical protein